MYGAALDEYIDTEYWAWLRPETIITDTPSLFASDVLPTFDLVIYSNTTSDAITLHSPVVIYRSKAVHEAWRETSVLQSFDAFQQAEVTGQNADKKPFGDDFWTSELVFPRSESQTRQLDWLAIPNQLGTRQTAAEQAIDPFSASDRSARAFQRSLLRRETFTRYGAERPLDYRISRHDAGCPLPVVEAEEAVSCSAP